MIDISRITRRFTSFQANPALVTFDFQSIGDGGKVFRRAWCVRFTCKFSALFSSLTKSSTFNLLADLKRGSTVLLLSSPRHTIFNVISLKFFFCRERLWA
jgi:hypothetical protein